MIVDDYDVVKICTSCARKRIKIRHHARKVKSFPATESLTYVSIDIFCRLLKSNNGNTALQVITDRSLKITETVPLRTTTAQKIATFLTKHWPFKYGPVSKLFVENEKQFILHFSTDT